MIVPKVEIEVNEKFYKVITYYDMYIVRRDVYWDSGYKDPIELEKIELIENHLADQEKEDEIHGNV